MTLKRLRRDQECSSVAEPLRGREGLGRKRYGSTRVQLLAEAASCPVWR